MPLCPGCNRSVPYHELQSHVRLCKWLWSDAPERESRWNDQLAERLGAIGTGTETDGDDDLERRLATIEERLSRLDVNEEEP